MKTFFQPRMTTNEKADWWMNGLMDYRANQIPSSINPSIHQSSFLSAACLVLSLLLLTASGVNAQVAPPDDFFHGGARHYLSNNIPAALQSVTNGLQLYPDDEKLKKLYELLNQQQQQQQDQKDQQQDKQDEKKDQQSKDDQQKKDEEKKQQEAKDKKEQEKKDQQQAKKDEEKKSGDPKPMEAHAMTPQEAKQMLDAQKGDEQVLLFKPEIDPKRQDKKLKDW